MTVPGFVRLITLPLFAVLAANASVAGAAPPEDARINLSAVQAGHDYQRFIVGFDAPTGGRPGVVSDAVAEVARGVGIGLQLRRQLATGAYLVEADSRLPEGQAVALMRAFARRAGVRYVEVDAMMRANFTPDDQYYNLQWHYHEALAGMNLPTAWDTATGSGVVVAVLDTGQTNHADLNGQFVPGYDFISDTFVSRDGDLRDPDPNDEGDWSPRYHDCYFGSPKSNSSWHGTHVAGTVAAATDNGIGVAGVAFNARIQHVRVLGRCGGYLSDIADAIVWASGGNVTGVPQNPTPAQVINMSLGGGGSCGATYQEAIDAAVGRGVTVVVAAGNSNADAANYRPASCNGVITVAASDRQGNRASYSNFGATVEIAAPGGETATAANGVASTLNDGATVQGGDIYVYYQGTSMAAPHISGLAALLYEKDPAITPARLLQTLQDSARPLAGSCSGGCGAGLADAGAAVALLAGVDPPVQEDLPPNPDFSVDCTDLGCAFTDLSTDDNGIISRDWQFGDGNGSSATNPTHTYAAADTYTVSLTVSDGVNALQSISRSVTVTAPPEPPPPSDVPAEPSNVVATAVTEGNKRNRVLVAVELSWTNNADPVTGFDIERCVEEGKGRSKTCVYAPVGTADATATRWEDPQPTANSRYQIRARNGGFISGWVESNSI